jgi:3-oxoacyl-[acyl-carrier-protein] synthase II
MGIVSPVGNELDEAWDNVCNGVSGIRLVDDFDTSTFPTRIGGTVRC